jgi:hypothetical protein
VTLEPVFPLLAPLVPLDAELELPDEEIGKEGGSRRTLHLQTPNAAQYLCKGPSLMPTHPFIGVNEWVVGGVARAMGIPIRSTEIIRWGGNLFFGSEVLERGRRMTGLLGTNWARLKNAPDVAYSVVTLDVWVLNTDRHDQNYLAGVLGNGVGIYLASDHDLGLFGIDRDVNTLPTFVDRPVDASLVPSEVLRNAITEWIHLNEAIGRAQAVDNGFIQTLLAQLPDAWINEAGRLAAFQFLTARRETLKDLFTEGRATFPNLPEEAP